ncbi:Uncharacterized protein Rs2_04738 [Raphanus sativus]|nr:Uncharacterized protein Rs2_04738 [Raphanus sativus]
MRENSNYGLIFKSDTRQRQGGGVVIRRRSNSAKLSSNYLFVMLIMGCEGLASKERRRIEFSWLQEKGCSSVKKLGEVFTGSDQFSDQRGRRRNAASITSRW